VETSDVRRRVTEAVDRARRGAVERRQRREVAAREYDALLSERAIPLFRQVANVLKVLGQPFTVSTPAGGVRIASDASPSDFVEIALDSTGAEPVAVGHACHTRGRRIVETERPIADVPIRAITEDHVLDFLLECLAPLLER
jgi:hypothetical protein